MNNPNVEILSETENFLHVRVFSSRTNPIDSYQKMYDLDLLVLSATLDHGNGNWYVICEKLDTYAK